MKDVAILRNTFSMGCYSFGEGNTIVSLSLYFPPIIYGALFVG